MSNWVHEVRHKNSRFKTVFFSGYPCGCLYFSGLSILPTTHSRFCLVWQIEIGVGCFISVRSFPRATREILRESTTTETQYKECEPSVMYWHLSEWWHSRAWIQWIIAGSHLSDVDGHVCTQASDHLLVWQIFQQIFIETLLRAQLNSRH